MEMLGKVRRMFYRDGMSRSEISRKTGLSRNTVKKWLRAEDGTEPKYRRPHMPRKLEPFQAQLSQALKADSLRPKRNRRTALALFAEIKAAAPVGTTSDGLGRAESSIGDG